MKKTLALALAAVLAAIIIGIGSLRPHGRARLSSAERQELRDAPNDGAQADISEARLRFSHWVQFRVGPGQAGSVQDLAKKKIQQQLEFLESSLNWGPIPGGTLADGKISDIRVVRRDALSGQALAAVRQRIAHAEGVRWDAPSAAAAETTRVYLAMYKYEVTAFVDSRAGSNLRVDLPNDPDTVFSWTGIDPEKDTQGSDKCTIYRWDGDAEQLWHSWAPRKPGCRLQEGRDYSAVTAELTPQRAFSPAAPELAQLRNAQGEIPIHVFFSIIAAANWGGERPAELRDPDSKSGSDYQDLRARLQAKGFSLRRWSADEVARVVGEARGEAAPFVEELEKQTPAGKIVVRLFYGDTDMGEDSHAFRRFYKDALEHASIVVYSGHSGFDANLDFQKMGTLEGYGIQADPQRYQVLFLNGCRTLHYYALKYLALKPNLALIVDGQDTNRPHADPTLEPISWVDDWASGKGGASYPDLARRIRDSRKNGLKGLTVVLGWP